jgi:hypothetical protein
VGEDLENDRVMDRNAIQLADHCGRCSMRVVLGARIAAGRPTQGEAQEAWACRHCAVKATLQAKE